MLLKRICEEKNIKLHTVLGYKINWINPLHKQIKTNFDFKIYEFYEKSDLYKYHDHSLGGKNTVPNKQFAIWLAKYINNNFLKLEIREKLKKFKEN
jgi:hypothetical protein